uniref:Uncharacterized protein n=1 Tax=Oryza brachyantha TaxID=4533 RepID=J3L890_ORYBR
MRGDASFAGGGEDAAADVVVLEITDTSFTGEADTSPPPPVAVCDLASLEPLPFPTISGGLFLAVENLLTECERWFRTMSSQNSSLLVPLDFLIEIWYFGQEHGITYVQDICPRYLAQNFVQVISRRSFVKMPYDLLYSTIECPHLTVDRQCCEELLPNSVDGELYLLNKVRICLLPLEFAAVLTFDFFAMSIRHSCFLIREGTKRNWAEFGSKKIVLSGCPQITTEILYISVLSTILDASFKIRIESSCSQADYRNIILYNELEKAVKTSSFGNVHMLDLSKCPNVHFRAAIDWLKLAFPELQIFKASFCLLFQFEDLLYLLLTCPWINEIDFTIDTGIISQKHSVISSRFEVRDADLLKISILKNSLCYINIKNCTLLTDDGISKLLLKCMKIHSMVLSYTSFGNQSIQMLCTTNPLDSKDECSHVMAFGMQELHLDGCQGIGYAAMSQLMSNVSMVSLAPVIRRSSNLRCLRAAGCRNLLVEHGEVDLMSGNIYGDFTQEITSNCCLEDVEMGWAFCPIRVTALIPSLSKVRKMTIGLGTTLGENILCALPEICPSLESLVLRFQMISDKVVRNLLESSMKLRVLCLYSCLGNLTSFSFQTKAPALRILRLERITPWMTNDDLAVLIQNYNLVELSLSGCQLLDSSSQELISSGWPNLTCLHLEECGQITLDGVSSILNCKALEDLLLRHTGKGIGRTIITDAISELPLLRKLALDLCDASEEGYDSPNNPVGKMIRAVRMSRCKSARSCFDLPSEGSSKRVHKETIVLEWSSRQLRTTIVKERL